jgi:hypothetical protein
VSEVDDAEARGLRDRVSSSGGVELVGERTDMKLTV